MLKAFLLLICSPFKTFRPLSSSLNINLNNFHFLPTNKQCDSLLFVTLVVFTKNTQFKVSEKKLRGKKILEREQKELFPFIFRTVKFREWAKQTSLQLSGLPFWPFKNPLYMIDSISHKKQLRKC